MESVTLAGQPVLNLRVETFLTAALELAAPEMEKKGVGLLRGVREEVLAARAFEGMRGRGRGYLSRLDPSPGLTRSIMATLRDLRRANARLDEARKRDTLTGLLRRSEWFARLSEEHARFLRDGQPYALAMFDIDHFKQVNDHLGHQAGDSVLASIARKLRRQIRRYDVLGRYGGEEFALLMPNTRLDEALLITDRIRQQAFTKLLDIAH